MERWREPSFARSLLLVAVAFVGGALLAALILGVYGYVSYKPNPTCGGLFCVDSATEDAEWDAFTGLFLGALGVLVGIGLWVLIKAATSHGQWTNHME